MTARSHISTRERVRIFLSNNATCHLCKQPILMGQPWDVSHETPLEMGGADDDTNRKPAHRKCHRAHTAAVDAPQIAKAKRREARHIGAYRSSNPLPGGRDSPLKRKIGGGAVPR